ncbi:Acyl-coenzyme A thioesterase 13 [Galemys pyrenaicus]|uniref:Acyl-coenzyme A thioesterase 13 n=1 Tax=Galemys pyrenaicus TaxID=202257 RepID=A0A8J6AKE5_GALPY|nr:Acyl-coenzyme A thioesterase 13 [Galemys pyrenaicus]
MRSARRSAQAHPPRRSHFNCPGRKRAPPEEDRSCGCALKDSAYARGSNTERARVHNRARNVCARVAGDRDCRFVLVKGPDAGERSTMGPLTQKLLEVIKTLKDARGFDKVLEKVTLVSAAPGKVVCELKVEDEHTNRAGTLHGGLTATLVDNISTLALLCTDRGAPGVSVDMNITYMSPAKIGEDVVITAHVLKQGKTLAFASVDLTNKATGKLVAQGRHTKHLGN